MRKYILESIMRFKNEIISKVMYDIVKWLFISLVLIIIAKWVPFVRTFFSKEFTITIYLIVISSVGLIAITTILVSSIFRKKIRKVLNVNHTDELTGLKNHKALSIFLNSKIQEYKNKTESLSIIIIDIDDFKNFNTKFGFTTADSILKKLGELLGNDKRATDETFRYFNRGDEFLIVASETNSNQAYQAAERKRKWIQKNLLSVDGINHQLTVCCGVTEFKKKDDYTSFTDRVIEALNVAKKVAGKNNTKSIV
jgi:diguanylate cyclase (GGDEF)-like protein